MCSSDLPQLCSLERSIEASSFEEAKQLALAMNPGQACLAEIQFGEVLGDGDLTTVCVDGVRVD